MNVLAISQADPSLPAAPMMARLFSIDGPMTVTLLDLASDQATATTPTPPPTGSIAVVARNCVRVPATVVSAGEGRFTLTLDEPLAGRRREQFVGLKPAAAHRRPDVAAAA
jgi:hypothetical protein